MWPAKPKELPTPALDPIHGLPVKSYVWLKKNKDKNVLFLSFETNTVSNKQSFLLLSDILKSSGKSENMTNILKEMDFFFFCLDFSQRFIGSQFPFFILNSKFQKYKNK